MRQFIKKGTACLAFAIASILPATAQYAIPIDFERELRGSPHPLNPLNPVPLTAEQKKTAGKVLCGGVAVVTAVAAGLVLGRRRKG